MNSCISALRRFVCMQSVQATGKYIRESLGFTFNHSRKNALSIQGPEYPL